MGIIFPNFSHCPWQAQGVFGTRSLYLESPQGSPFPEPPRALCDTNQADLNSSYADLLQLCSDLGVSVVD